MAEAYFDNVSRWGNAGILAGEILRLHREFKQQAPVAEGGAWSSIRERLPDGDGDVLTWHPNFKEIRRRSANTVRIWASDPSDTSMMDSMWHPLPAPPMNGGQDG